MNKRVDFITEHNEEMKELLEAPHMPPNEREWQRLQLTKELVEAQESQYARIKNKERWDKLEREFYPVLCEIAKIQGGCVELKIDEAALTGQLVYTGEGLTLGNSDPKGQTTFSKIVASAEDIFVSTHEGYFKFQFFFCLYDKVFVEDHAEQIAKIKEKIQFYRTETMKRHQIFSEEK